MGSVQLVIRTLPELPHNAKYRCVFGNSTPIDATVLENGLSCQTPPVQSRPAIDAQRDHVLVPLSVRSSETNKDFVSRSFAFFDCSRHSSCRQCVQSNWNCNWCIYDNKCVHNTTSCRNTGSVITVKSVRAPSYISIQTFKFLIFFCFPFHRPVHTLSNSHNQFFYRIKYRKRLNWKSRIYHDHRVRIPVFCVSLISKVLICRYQHASNQTNISFARKHRTRMRPAQTNMKQRSM